MYPASRLVELFEDWKYLIQRDGLRAALPQLGIEFARLPCRHLRFLILAHSLLELLPDLPPSLALEIRPFVQTDLDYIQKIDRPSEARLCGRKLERGHKGLLALREGVPAGYAWGSPAQDQQLERIHCPYEPGDVLLTDVFTAPAFRGKGIQTALTLARFGLFRDLGYCRAISTIEVHNGPSLAVWQRKLGAETIGEIDFLRVGPWRQERYYSIGTKSILAGQKLESKHISVKEP